MHAKTTLSSIHSLCRALDELFQLIGSHSPSAQCRVTVSYIEIYKEELRDLLDGGSVAQQPLVIREDEQGNTGGVHVPRIKFFFLFACACMF